MDGIDRNTKLANPQNTEQLKTPKLSISLIVVAVLFVLLGTQKLIPDALQLYRSGEIDLGIIFGVISVYAGVGILRKKRFWYLVARVFSFMVAALYALVAITLVLLPETDYFTIARTPGLMFGLAYIFFMMAAHCWMFWVLGKSAHLFTGKRK